MQILQWFKLHLLGFVISVCIYWKKNSILLSFFFFGVHAHELFIFFLYSLVWLIALFLLFRIQNVLYFHVKWWNCLFSWKENINRFLVEKTISLVKPTCCITVDPSMPLTCWLRLPGIPFFPAFISDSNLCQKPGHLYHSFAVVWTFLFGFLGL